MDGYMIPKPSPEDRSFYEDLATLFHNGVLTPPVVISRAVADFAYVVIDEDGEWMSLH